MPESKTSETVEHCDLCGSGLERATHVYDFNGFSLVRCASCGLVLTNPRPTRQSIGGFYGTGYYAYLPPDARSWRERLKDAVLGELGGYPDSALPCVVTKPAAWLLRAHIMVVPPYVAQGKLLDGGSGARGFLYWAKRAGWEATGLEVDGRAVEEGRRAGLDIVLGRMEDCPLPDESFDTVVLNHSLEHCHDPNQVLVHCYRVMKPGGLLIVGVPNFDCYDNLVFEDSWSNCDAPRHLYHFNPDTLTTMMKKHGFEVERIRFKKWLIPHSEQIGFRFLRRKLSGAPWTERSARTLSTRFRIQVVKKLALALRLWPDRLLGQFMTAYARRVSS